MNSNTVTTIEKTDNGRYSDIYADEIKTNIKTHMRFTEAWLQSSSIQNSELFQYADPDFYFFRFTISRQEKSTERLRIRCLISLVFWWALSDSNTRPTD